MEHHKDGYLDNAIYVTTKIVLNNLIAELRSDQKGNVSDFFWFTRHKDASVYISPKIYQFLVKNLLPIDEETYSQIDSLVCDGGLIIGTRADFGTEIDDVIVIANALSVRYSSCNIFIIKAKTQDDIPQEKLYPNVAVFDIDGIISIIKTADKEFRKLCWGI